MKHTKKLLTMVGVIALTAAIAIGGTLAYLTSTDEVTNTFTVGNVEIKLDETEVNPDGTPVTPAARTEKGNEYHLLPGHTYTKDPTITVLKGSEKSYVRALVTINEQPALDAIFAKEGGIPLNKVLTGTDSKWEFVGEKRDGDTKTYELRYKETVNASEADVKLAPVFTEIVMPGTITNTELATIEELEIKVVAQAIQADGFDTAADAWAAFEG